MAGAPSRIARASGSLESKSRSGFSVQPLAVLGSQPRRVGPDVFLERPGEGLARLPRGDAVERRDQVRQPQRAEEAEEHAQDLRVARRRGHADQLEADLAELAVTAGLRLLVAKLRPRVPEANGPRHLLKTLLHQRADDARRVLGPQREGAALAVGEGVHLLVHDVGRVADRAGEQLRALEDGRANLGVAEGSEHAARRVFGRGESLARGGQKVVRSLGRPNPPAHRAHFPSILKYSSL